MKNICVLCVVLLFLVSCANQDVNKLVNSSTTDINTEFSVESETKHNIIGEYICQGYMYEEFMDEYPEFVPSINFYDDGSCKLRVYYIGGVDDVKGEYSVKGDEIHVKLDLEWTFFEGTDSAGLPYMDDEYIFTITDEDHLVIDREFYVVHAKESFVRISAEPEITTEPEYDIIGKYVCSSDYYNDSSWAIPYIKFLKEGHCMLFVDQEGGREIWGQYKIEENRIYVSELRFRYLEMIDEVRDNMEHEYVFTIVDEDHLTIDRGFFNVQAGDTFVRR